MRLGLGAEDGGDRGEVLAELPDSLKQDVSGTGHLQLGGVGELFQQESGNIDVDLHCQKQLFIGPPGVNFAGWVWRNSGGNQMMISAQRSWYRGTPASTVSVSTVYTSLVPVWGQVTIPGLAPQGGEELLVVLN